MYTNFSEYITTLQKSIHNLPGLDAQIKMAHLNRATLDWEQALQDNPKIGAVLVCIFPKEEIPHLVFIKRKTNGGAHSGQIAFPGGKQEANETIVDTALRESFEEVGIRQTDVSIIGKLTPIYVPVSNFLVYPIVGYLKDIPQFSIQESEVEHTLTFPINTLFSPDSKDITSVQVKDFKLKTPCYKIDETIIWGATAMMLSELEALK